MTEENSPDHEPVYQPMVEIQKKYNFPCKNCKLL